MTVNLTLRPRTTLREGGPLLGGEPVEYDIVGLPPGDSARIALIHGRWQIMRFTDRAGTDWLGDYATADNALAALQRQVYPPPDPAHPCPACSAPMQERRMWDFSGNPDLGAHQSRTGWRCLSCKLETADR